MELSSNEWLEITTTKTMSDMAEPFASPVKKFLYPSPGEAFCIRLLGKLYPYYRSYINPRFSWIGVTTPEQLKKAMSGDTNSALSIVKSIIDKSKEMGERYKINWEDKKIEHIMMRFYKTPPSESVKIDLERMTFLQSCLDSKTNSCHRALWSPCVICNAYVRNGNRFKGSFQPVVITKSMFMNMAKSQVESNGMSAVQDMTSSNISGIHAFDLALYRESSQGYKSPLLLKIYKAPNTLTYDEVATIIKQKLIHIESFIKFSNKEMFDAMNGFVYKPYKSLRDATETLKVLQEIEGIDVNEEYEAAEKELCNISPELANENAFENGPISGIEIV